MRWDVDHSSPFQTCYLGKTSWVEQESWTFYTREYCQQYCFLPKQVPHERLSKQIYRFWYTLGLCKVFKCEEFLTGDTIAAVYAGKTCCCSYKKGQGVCGSSARQDINAPLPSRVIPFLIIGIHCYFKAMHQELRFLWRWTSVPLHLHKHHLVFVLLEAVPPGIHCNSYNELTEC